jgi:tetratricopeptide (TPR) repeat protein
MCCLKPAFILAACFVALLVFSLRAQVSPLTAAKLAFESGEYAKAVTLLESAAAKDPNNGDIQFLLTKAYLETNHTEAAVKSAEKAVSIDPNNSEYHDWLGQAYGDKASHASVFSAYPLARKTQKEFETAVKLDERNFDATQNLIEYDCTAPSIVGGGDEKAQPLIQKLLTMDAAQGHYAQGNCRMQKKDMEAVDAEFTKALESHPKSMNQIREMVFFFADRGEGDKVLLAANAAAVAAPGDPRIPFFRSVGWILKGQNLAEAENGVKEYLRLSSPRSDYPSPSAAHYWLGRWYETQKNPSGARAEYQTALKLNPKNKNAQDALKKLGGS